MFLFCYNLAFTRKILEQNNVKKGQCLLHIIRCNNPSLAFPFDSCQIKVQKIFHCLYFIADTEKLQLVNLGLPTNIISNGVQVQSVGDDNGRGTTPFSMLPSNFEGFATFGPSSER